MATESERSPDALIVGGGVIGLAVAWRAAQRGLAVRILERDGPGAGASGVAAGMLAPVGEASWGEERLLALATRSLELWPGFARELAEAAGREVGFSRLGALHVGLDRDEIAELRRRHELMRSLELEASWLGSSGCRELEPGLSPAILGGVHAPHEAAVDPGRVCEALAAALDGAGVEIRSGCAAAAPLLEGGRLAGVLDADGEEHRAPVTVLAAGAWSGSEWLPPALRPPVRPVKGQILTLRAPGGSPPCARIVVSERVYLVPREDGRLIVGATVEEQGFDRRVTAGGVHELLREAYRALPEVAELELVEAVASLRPGTPDNLPVVGSGAVDGLVLATGHFRNGFLLAPWTAEEVATLAAGGPPSREAPVAAERGLTATGSR